jgi:hypothetical protein
LENEVATALQTFSSTTASLGDDLTAATKRQEAMEAELASLRRHADNAVAALEKNFRQVCEQFQVQSAALEERCCKALASKVAESCKERVIQQQQDSQFEKKAEELQHQLADLDSQGSDICNTLKDQARRRSQFEEDTAKRLESLERRIVKDVIQPGKIEEATSNPLESLQKNIQKEFSSVRKEISRLREALDVETMVREDADGRLQGSVSEAEVTSQALKKAMSDLSARLKATLETSVAESCALLSSKQVASPNEKLSGLAEQDEKRLLHIEEQLRLCALRGLAEQEERRLHHIEEQLRLSARSSEREITAVRSDLLSLQESVLAETVNSSTSSLLKRVVALESEHETASASATRQLADEKKLHETEAQIHREQTVRALREERELREQSQMQLERRLRLEVEAHGKEKERRKEVEFSLDRRISDISSTVTEVRQHVRLLGMGAESFPTLGVSVAS